MARLQASYNPLLKSYPDSDKINAVSEGAEVLYVRLLAQSDDAGRYYGEPSFVLGKLFTARMASGSLTAAEIESRILELEQVGLIRRYISGQVRYLELIGAFKTVRNDRSGVIRFPEPTCESGHRMGTDWAPDGNQMGTECPPIPIPIPRPTQDPDPELNQDPSPPPADGIRQGDRSSDIKTVFEHYRTYHPKAHPSPSSGSKAWKRIRERLGEGYSTEDLARAIDGCHLSPFHNGANETGTKYHALELIMRDSDQVAKFLEIASHPPSPVMSVATQLTLAAADSYLSKRASEDGYKDP